MKEVIIDNWRSLLPILLLNWMMLLFGFLGEMNVIPIVTANILGFIPFMIYFGMIYHNFAKDFTIGRITFVVFFVLWGLYGVAAFLPYGAKNIIFNILDLFAKNFFGIFLATLIVYKMKKPEEKEEK
jgi:glycopeptide antibiotics resistance protein